VDTGFIFDNVPVRDAYNGKGFVNGMVTHKRLRDWGVDLRIQANNMIGLNTTSKDNSLFYGKAFATGNIAIKGKADHVIAIGIDVTTDSLTDMALSLDGATTVVENNFVTFVSRNKEKTIAPVADAAISKSNLAVNLKINATPNAKVKVLLDPSIGGNIKGRGGGIMEMNLDENGKFSIFGKYTLASGDFNLAYADILTRTFKLENGSSLAWNGNLMEGIMDVRAMQTAKVSNPGSPNNTISVNNSIKLSGNILHPDFSFTFTLPDVDDEYTRTTVYNLVDTSNREEMIKQMASILFLGRFASAENSIGSSLINNSISHSISELVSFQINRMVSEIFSNADVHIIYQPSGNDGENRGQYSTEIKGSLFKNKLIITTNLGVIESNKNNEDNQFLREVLAEVILNGSLKIKGFNLSNQQDLLLYNARYSQGVGLSYSKDFDKFKDLFVRKNRIQKKK
jgi:hypothetical protein